MIVPKPATNIELGRLAMERYYELKRDETPRTQAWYSINNAFIAHFHSTIELIYVLEGEICAMQDGVTRWVGPQHLIVNSSYVLHAYHTPSYSRVIVITLPLSALPSLRAQLNHHSFLESVVDVSDMPEASALACLMAQGGHGERFVNSLGEALVALLVERVGLRPSEADAEGDLMRRILSYLQQNVSAPLSLRAVAAHFGYSAGRFSHIFNRRVGCTFPRYVNTLRCSTARRMLSQGVMPLTDVAAASGFSSMRTFHRVYKQVTGQTPRAEETS